MGLTPGEMHADQLVIDKPLVRSLLADQFPNWAKLPLERVVSSGTVNTIFRLGDEFSLRLPIAATFDDEITREWSALCRFADRLPLSVPKPVALGLPTQSYPCHWLILNWIDGQNATPPVLRAPADAAASLGKFVAALRSIGTGNTRIEQYRGKPLILRDRLTREAISQLTDEYNCGALTRVWQSALEAEEWAGGSRFFHGDLHAGNLLARDGCLTAVIDFGGFGTGDPSVDAIPGWWMFSGRAREVFRDAGGFDKEMWDKGRGWALSIAVIALPYYRRTNITFADMARRAIDEVLADSP